jgi:DNA-binding transcriptional regulator LsrR (DeoR family)
LVLDIPEDQAQSLREQLGGAAANLLDEIVTPDDVVGLAWARSSMAMSAALKHLARCTVVQLTGALPRLEPEDSSIELEDSSIELVRNVAHVCGGPAYYFYAPMIVATPQTAQSLRQLPEVARAMACFDSVTKAVVGVGSWDPTCSTVYDALEPSERGALGRLGVHAEVSGILIDIDGSPVPAPLIQRTIAITAQQLRAVPEVIAIAYGSAKAGAVLASIRGGLVKSLVTHRSLGHALIEAASAADGGVDGAAEGAASRAGVEGRPGGT